MTYDEFGFIPDELDAELFENGEFYDHETGEVYDFYNPEDDYDIDELDDEYYENRPF